MELSVVVPVLNEAGNIGPLVAEIRAALAQAEGVELIVVDDASSDATAAVLAALPAGYPALRVLHHDRRCGQSRAIVSGVRAARGICIATLDGDGQNDPADLPRLWAHWRAAGADARLLLVGHRQVRRDSWTRRLASRLANALRARLLGDHTPDTGCGLKLLPRDLFLELPYFDHMHRYLPALVLRAGGRVESLPVNHRPRIAGHSHYGILDRLAAGLVDLLGVLWLCRRSRRPRVHESGVA